MEAGEERKVGLPLTEHEGVIADGIVGERSSQTGEHHMLTPEVLTQSAGLLEVIFDVVAVGGKHHKLTLPDQVFKCVGTPVRTLPMAGHPLHRSHVVLVHACNGRRWKRTEQRSAGPRSQHQAGLGGFLHRAVVGQRCRIQAHAVEADPSVLEVKNPLLDQVGIEAAGEERIALQTEFKRHPTGSPVAR